MIIIIITRAIVFFFLVFLHTSLSVLFHITSGFANGSRTAGGPKIPNIFAATNSAAAVVTSAPIVLNSLSYSRMYVCHHSQQYPAAKKSLSCWILSNSVLSLLLVFE